MQKGLGIAALVVAIISIFIPFVGTWLTLLAGLLAAFAYGPGIALAIGSIIINIVHLFFFSPLLWVSHGVASSNAYSEFSADTGISGEGWVLLPWILIAVQIGCGLLLFFLQNKQRKI